MHADLIEALIGTGELDRAGGARWREARGEASRVPWSLATRARCRALLLAAHGELDAAERSLEQALTEHERCPVPFERARTLLALSGLQRRKNERRRADQSLSQALSIFDGLAPLCGRRGPGGNCVLSVGARRAA